MNELEPTSAEDILREIGRGGETDEQVTEDLRKLS